MSTRVLLILLGLVLFEPFSFAGAQSEPRVNVVWQKFEDSSFDILFSQIEKGSWTDPIKVYSSENQVSSVVLTTLSEDKKVLFWSERIKSKTQIYYRTMNFSKRGLESLAAVRVFKAGCNTCLAIFPIMETDGNLRLLWSDTKNGLDDIFTAKFDGVNWTQIEKVNLTNDVPDILPLAELEGSGATLVKWKSYSRVAGKYLIAQRVFQNPGNYIEIKQDFTDMTTNQIPRLSDLPYNSRLFYHLPDNKLKQNVPVN